MKFCIWECLEVKMGQKIRPRVSEGFLGPKVTTPQIWGSAEISDTKKNFFYVSTKTMPNLKNVLQIVVEIDGGGAGHSHSNRTTSKSAPHANFKCFFFYKIRKKLEITAFANLISSLIQMHLPVCKMFFWQCSEKIHWWLFFMSFSLRECIPTYYRGKIEGVYIQAKTECVYQRKCIPLKIKKSLLFTNLGHLVILMAL